jgi:hypothetical protein
MRIGEFKDPFTGRKGVYLFTTDHLERTLLFRDRSDFVQGVNSIAFATLMYPSVKVLCYTLMDNHIHILLMGRYADCRAFFAWVLHRLARIIGERHGISGILKLQASDVQAVVDRDMFLNEVCYLLRNGYKARIDSPYSYPWAPFECYFNPFLPFLRGTPVPGTKTVKRMFGTHVKIPSDWEHIGGCVLNKCFIDYRTVELKIGSSLVFFDRLRRFDLESVVDQRHGIEEKLTFTDSEVQEKIRAICKNELHKESHHQLERKDLLWLARTLARRFATPKKQIARLLGIEPAILEQLL